MLPKTLDLFKKGTNLPVTGCPYSKAWALALKQCSYWSIFKQCPRTRLRFSITFSICILLRLPFVIWSSDVAPRSSIYQEPVTISQ